MADELTPIASEILADAPRAREEIPSAPVAGEPEANPSAQAAPIGASGAATHDTIAAIDRLGRSFDKKLHQTRPDGSPILTKKGQLAIRGGRPVPGGSVSAVGGSPVAPPLPNHEQARRDELARIRTTAAITVQSFASIAAMIGGEPWNPTDAERAQLTDAWAEYYRVRGIRDVPPEVMLAAVMGGWALGTPERRGQLKAAGERIVARVNRGKNGQRKNNVGETIDRFISGDAAVHRARPDGGQMADTVGVSRAPELPTGR